MKSNSRAVFWPVDVQKVLFGIHLFEQWVYSSKPNKECLCLFVRLLQWYAIIRNDLHTHIAGEREKKRNQHNSAACPRQTFPVELSSAKCKGRTDGWWTLCVGCISDSKESRWLAIDDQLASRAGAHWLKVSACIEIVLWSLGPWFHALYSIKSYVR